jgi:hypothetical protein
LSQAGLYSMSGFVGVFAEDVKVGEVVVEWSPGRGRVIPPGLEEQSAAWSSTALDNHHRS